MPKFSEAKRKERTVTTDGVSQRKAIDRVYAQIASGSEAQTLRIVISADGKTRTQTQTGKNPQGQTVNNTRRNPGGDRSFAACPGPLARGL